ncbi:MAG: RDD family protein [Pyrinomonadaceae bacterium]
MTSTVERSASSQRPERKELIAEFHPEQLKAPFALRCGALCIDYILMIAIPVVTLLIGVFLGGAARSQTGGVSNSTGWLLGTLLCMTNFFILPAVGGQTIGKMLTGIRIVKMDGSSVSFGTILLRDLVGYLITGVTLGLGFIFSIFSSKGRALHDYIAGTVVVYATRRTR